jgi:ubiquinone/menaquinone biosynthesis C-methylase UbiE
MMSTKRMLLDVGCGESFETLRFLEEFLSGEDVFIVGVDWSYIFCKQSKVIARRHNLDAEYVRCDVAFLPFRDRIFHYVCMLDSMRCLKAHNPEDFVREAFQKLAPNGELYITGLDNVSFQQKNLPAFKDKSLALSWTTYVPLNESHPFISKKPNLTEAINGQKYKQVGLLPNHVVSELLRRCNIKPETIWKTERQGNYCYHRYIITVKKRVTSNHKT